ncbi:hypothetical protein Tco_1303025 [Tanacetum coccineum]
MIQPEPGGSTQGYPLDSVEVLRFYTSAGNPVKDILLKLNLPEHRILKDGGEDATYIFSSQQDQERYEHDGPEVTCFTKMAKVTRIAKRELWRPG